MILLYLRCLYPLMLFHRLGKRRLSKSLRRRPWCFMRDTDVPLWSLGEHVLSNHQGRSFPRKTIWLGACTRSLCLYVSKVLYLGRGAASYQLLRCMPRVHQYFLRLLEKRQRVCGLFFANHEKITHTAYPTFLHNLAGPTLTSPSWITYPWMQVRRIQTLRVVALG